MLIYFVSSQSTSYPLPMKQFIMCCLLKANYKLNCHKNLKRSNLITIKNDEITWLDVYFRLCLQKSTILVKTCTTFDMFFPSYTCIVSYKVYSNHLPNTYVISKLSQPSDFEILLLFLSASVIVGLYCGHSKYLFSLLDMISCNITPWIRSSGVLPSQPCRQVWFFARLWMHHCDLSWRTTLTQCSVAYCVFAAQILILWLWWILNFLF